MVALEFRKCCSNNRNQSKLFPRQRANRFLTNGVLNKWYDALAIEAGVPRISSHGARHTAGSSYAIMGAGQKMIATMLGHADTAATERYTHVKSDATSTLANQVRLKTRHDQVLLHLLFMMNRRDCDPNAALTVASSSVA